MGMQTIEIALPSDLITQIDAEVGPAHRSEFFARLAQEAVHRRADKEKSAASEQAPGPHPLSRFRPVKVKGEPVSVTIMRDRGSF